ncbi:PepSY domain-containing protein [Microbulbifer aggregans]|uniref:PepSY domain-containing protein n=1 Tax=Microbulbifer aggregans TaxID=1769779 RepID=UPI001CFD986D|nr:PepSY domain-containing protein [Microbulbifer aggregans]
MKKLSTTLAGIALGILTIAQPLLADEKPPPGAMALSVVLTKLEQQGFTPIIDVSLDKERWEIEAFKEGEKYELVVDPNSGEILESRKDSE